MSCAVAIFVKTPALSEVKTRLWPGIGRASAEQLHCASAQAVRSVVARASVGSNLEGYWAVAETAHSSSSHWPGLAHVEQGQGSLGERMATVHRKLHSRYRRVVLIGADAPQIEPSMLTEAAGWLASDSPRLAIGRACDGGFWLFGSNQDLPAAAWTRAQYSRVTTADEFIAAMTGFGDWIELQTLRDIDTTSDIELVRARLRSLPEATPEQIRLAELLGELALVEEPAR
jgi:uncharacterized protein